MAKINWKSGVRGDWNTAADWVGGVPGAGDDVTIAAAGNYTVTIDHSEAAQSITLNSAHAVLAENAKNVTLTLGTGLTVTAGTLSITGVLSATELIQGGIVTVSNGGVFSVVGRAGDQPSSDAAEITSGVNLEGTTSIGTDTILSLQGGGLLGGTIGGAGEIQLTGAYIANTASLDGLSLLSLGAAELDFTTSSGTLTDLNAQDSSTLSVASGLSLTVSDYLQFGQEPTSIFPESSFANVISGPGTLITTSVAEINGNTMNATELTIGGGLTWVNSGELRISGEVVFNKSQGDSATLINQASGTVLFEQPGGLTFGQTGNDLFSNAGALDSSGNVTIAVPLDSTGVIDPEGTLTLSGGGTLGGILDDTGTLALTGNYTLTPGGLSGDALGNGNLALNDGVLDVGASSTFAGGFGTDGGNDELVIASGADFTLTGTATIGQVAAQNPNLYIIGPGTLTTLGTTTLDDAGSGVSLVGQGTWINGGTVTDDARIDLGDTTSSSDLETIVNQAGATFDVEGPDGGILVNGAGTGMFDNFGTLMRGSDSGTSTIAAFVNSTGIIDVVSGTLALTGGGIINGAVDGAGTLLLSAGHFTVEQPGRGNGHIVVGAGATVTYDTVLDGYGTLTLASGQVKSYGGTLTIGDGSGGYIVTGAGTFATTGATALTDLGSNVNLYLESSATWSNTGTANVLGAVAFGNPGANDTAALVNKGVFNLVGDDARLAPGSGNDSGLITNSGTFAKTSGSGTNTVSVAFNTTKLVNVASGTIALVAGGSIGGTLNGTGALSLASNNYTLTSPTLMGTGTLVLATNGNLAETTNNSIATSVVMAGGSFSGNTNTLTTAGVTTLLDSGTAAAFSVDGGTWANTGSVNDAGVISLFSQSSGFILNKGLFNFTSDDGNVTSGYGAGSFTNTGTISKTGGSGTSTIVVPLLNTGLITIATGSIDAVGGGTLGGTLSGAGTLALAGAFATAGMAGAGHLVVSSGSTLTETATGTIAPSLTLAGGAYLALATGATAKISGALSLGDANGFAAISGPGTISTSGATTIFDGGPGTAELTLNGALIWTSSGTVNDGGLIYTGYASAPGGASVVNSGTFNFTSDDGSLTVYDANTTNTFTNTGTLAKTGGTGTSLLSATINGNGAIAVASGTLALAGGGAVNGVLTGAGLLDLAGGIFTSAGLSGAGHLAVTGATSLTETASGTIAASVAASRGGDLAAVKSVTLTLPGQVTLGDATGFAAMSGPGTISTTGATTIFDGGSGTPELVLNGGLIWVNSGTVNDSGLIYTGYASAPGGASLVNSGSFNFTGDHGSLTVYDANTINTFTNTGTLAKTGGTGTSLLSATINSTGAIAVASGTLALTGGGAVSGVLTGAGLLDLAGGVFTSAGLSGTGRLAVTGATSLTETTSGTTASSVLASGGGSLAAAQSVTLTLPGQVTLGDVTGFGGMSGPGTILTTGVTTIFDGGSGTPEMVLNGGLVWVNSGAVNEGGLIYTGYSSAPGGAALVNSGSFDFTSDDGSLTVYDANTSNSFTNTSTGTLGKTGGTGTSLVAATVISTGAIAVASGTLALTGGGAVSGVLTGAGLLDLAAGAFTTAGLLGAGHLAITGATSLTETASGTIASSVLASAGGSLGAAASVTLTLPGQVTVGGATGFGGMSGPGTISTTGVTTIFDGGSGTPDLVLNGGLVWINSGTINDGGLIDTGYASAPGGATLVNSGTFDFTSDDGSVAVYDGNTSNSFTNTSTGTLAKTGGTGTSSVGVSIANAGTIEAASGTLQLAGGVTGSGTLKIDAGATLDIGVVPVTQSIVFNGGALATLKLDAPASIGALTNFTLGDRLDLAGASVTSASISGTTLTVVTSASGTFTYSSAGLAGEAVAVSSDGAGGSFVTVTSNYTTYTLGKGNNVIHGANGAGDIFIATAASINSGDQLTGGNGANSMTLKGAGTFNLNLPSVFTNIPTVNGIEGQAATTGTKPKPDTRQTIQLRDGATETLNIAAGTAAAGNKNPESVIINADTGSYTINLAHGADQVTLGSGSATVTLGGSANSVVGGGGTALILGTAALAGASVIGSSSGQTTLEVTNGGVVTLNGADTYLTVQLDLAGTLKLSAMAFVTGIGSSGADTLTALGGTQTLTGGAGIDTLIGYGGGNDSFADTAAGLNGDTIKGWTTGDVIDLKDVSASTLHALSFSANTLTVTDGSHSSAIKFAAGLTLSNFTVLGSNGGTGVLIGYHG